MEEGGRDESTSTACKAGKKGGLVSRLLIYNVRGYTGMIIIIIIA